jgi:hypothetical protein
VNYEKIDFRKKLSIAQKKKISYYETKLTALTSFQPVKISKSQNIQKIKKINAATGVKGLKGLKVAFTPVASPTEKQKIKIDKYKNLVVSEKYFKKIYIPIKNKKDFFDNPINELSKMVKPYENIEFWSFSASGFDMSIKKTGKMKSIGAIANQIYEWIYIKYGNTDKITGIIGWIPINQSSFEEYQAAKKEFLSKKRREKNGKKNKYK